MLKWKVSDGKKHYPRTEHAEIKFILEATLYTAFKHREQNTHTAGKLNTLELNHVIQ
jgi:hypothetical protein